MALMYWKSTTIGVIYAKDPNDNLVEFCVTTGSFDEQDRKRALEAITSNELEHSKPPASIDVHRAVH